MSDSNTNHWGEKLAEFINANGPQFSTKLSTRQNLIPFYEVELCWLVELITSAAIIQTVQALARPKWLELKYFGTLACIAQ